MKKNLIITFFFLLTVLVQPCMALTKNVVFDFGANPTDGNDDTYAFQSALLWARNNPGNSIYVPSGWYTISSELKIYNNTRLYGDGGTSHLKYNYTNIGGVVKWNMISVFGAGNNIHDLELIGKGVVPVNEQNNITSGGSMIVLYGMSSKNNNIYNMRFLKHEGIAILATNYASYFNVFNNFSWMCSFETFQARGGAHHGKIYSNVIRNADDDALSVVWYPEDGTSRPYGIDIYLNELYDCDGGINVSHAKDIQIRNNFISNSQMAGIKVSYWTRGIGLDVTSSSFIPSDPADNISISYNQLLNCGSAKGDNPSWDASSSNAMFLYGVINSEIFGNHIWRTLPLSTTMKKTAIRIMDHSNLSVHDNVIDCNGYVDAGIAIYDWITPTPVNNTNLKKYYKLSVIGNSINKPAETGFTLNPPLDNIIQEVVITNNAINDCLGSIAGWLNKHAQSTVSDNTVNNWLPIIY